MRASHGGFRIKRGVWLWPKVPNGQGQGTTSGIAEEGKRATLKEKGKTRCPGEDASSRASPDGKHPDCSRESPGGTPVWARFLCAETEPMQRIGKDYEFLMRAGVACGESVKFI
jgi:hypothetical protein